MMLIHNLSSPGFPTLRARPSPGLGRYFHCLTWTTGRTQEHSESQQSLSLDSWSDKRQIGVADVLDIDSTEQQGIYANNAGDPSSNPALGKPEYGHMTFLSLSPVPTQAEAPSCQPSDSLKKAVLAAALLNHAVHVPASLDTPQGSCLATATGGKEGFTRRPTASSSM